MLIITGTTLANDTLGDLIALAKPSARIVVVGPTVTMIPDAFFEKGCHIVGGIEVTDPDAFLDILGLPAPSARRLAGRTSPSPIIARHGSLLRSPWQGATAAMPGC